MSAPSATPRGIRSWIGYKLHIDAADASIPVSCILTSASLHDSQVAIPLATMTDARVTNLYDLMDSAYDAVEIREHSQALGHVAIIDENPRRDAARKQALLTEAQAQRASGYVYPRGRALPGALDRRAGQRPAQGRVWCSPRPRARSR